MRYRVDGLPPSKVGAFMPIPALAGDDYAWGEVHRFGAPGTLPVAARAIRLNRATNATAPNDARPSSVAPDAILPQLYVAMPNNMGPEHGSPGLGMTRRHRNELPVPAFGWTRLAKALPLIVAKGSRITQAWPRAFQRYPTSQG